MNKQLYIFCLFTLPVILFSQERWQQRVEYRIGVDLNVETNIIKGKETVKYYNNSPDTLKEIYYHLYWNAFKPGSYMNIKGSYTNRDNAIRISTLLPEEQGNVNVDNIKIDGENVKSIVYGTIMKIDLNKPLKPNSCLEVALEFTSQVPKMTRRAGRDNNQGIRYSMAQWYPKICEYDFEGWHHDQYAGREFYGVWGDFDVIITLDANYVIGATGIIQNPDEVKCGYELGRRDTIWVKNPADTFPKGKTKTWHFKAENVHDFAWAADDKYIHDIAYWNDVTIHNFYIPSSKEQRVNVKYYSRDMLDFYSGHYGKYPYKQFTVVQAGDGGMEYPMITFNGSGSPGLVGHEGGHEWFYGLLGNNESREAWLDEGIITYTTDFFMMEKYGNPAKYIPGEIYLPPYDIHGNYKTYWQIAKLGIEEPMLTHSDYFLDDLIYNFETYMKGSFIIPMLEYVIGDDVLKKMMKTYFDKWHFKHPHSSDFQRVAEEVSGMELDWFFDEWLRSTKTCDYAVNKFSGKWINDNGKSIYKIYCELENRDEIIMPVDLVLTLKNGKKQKMIIPIEWEAKEETNAIILPRWDWVNKKYSFSYSFDEEVVSAEIDPSLRLKDLNRLNNTSGCLPEMDFNFIRPIQVNPPVDAYWVQIEPSLFYSIFDGIKIGAVTEGGYLGGVFIPPDYQTHFDLWYCTKSKQVDFDLGYSSSISGFGKMAYLNTTFSKKNGIRNIKIEINKLLEPFHPTYMDKKSIGLRFENNQLIENDFPYYNINWQRGGFNTLQLFYNQTDLQAGSYKIDFVAELGFNSPVNYSKVILELVDKILSEPEIKLRVYTGFSSGLPPIQKQFNLTSSNSYEQYNSDLYSNLIGLNRKFTSDVNLGLEGGGNLRGYVSRFNEFNGKDILAVNLETGLIYPFRFIKIPLINDIKAGLFFDCGNVYRQEFENGKAFLEDMHFDGGVLFEYSPFDGLNARYIKTIIPFLRNFIIRFNIPFWLSHPEAGKQNFDLNWNVSIGKAIDI
jgi:hypothetical protein